ncbi:unnamed protein product [Calypogeia fissa]
MKLGDNGNSMYETIDRTFGILPQSSLSLSWISETDHLHSSGHRAGCESSSSPTMAPSTQVQITHHLMLAPIYIVQDRHFSSIS